MLRSDYPLGVIYSAKNLAKKVARDQHRDDKVDLVGPEMDTAILGRITIKLASIGELYHKVLKEATELQENLFGGIGFGDEEWFSFEVPDRFTDLVNSDRPGYCFGDEEGNNFKRYQDCGLNVLLHHPYFKDRYGCMVADGQFIPNAVACHDFLRQSSEVDSMIAVLFHTGLGSPGRGTESTSQFLRNHPQGNIRNIKIVEGRLCVVGGYNKSSSMVSSPSRFHSMIATDIRPRQEILRRSAASFRRVFTTLYSFSGSLSGQPNSTSHQYSGSSQR